MRTLVLGLAATSLAGAAPAQDAPEVPEAVVATYACEGGASLAVAYLNAPAGGPSYAVVSWDGRLLPMKAGPTGSGVRYVTIGGDAPMVWHVKGGDGFLARDDAGETTVLGGCAETD